MEWSPFALKILFASGFSLFHLLITTSFTSQNYNVCDEILYSDISTYRRGHGPNDFYYLDQTLLHDIHKSTLHADYDFDFDFDFENTYSIPLCCSLKPASLLCSIWTSTLNDWTNLLVHVSFFLVFVYFVKVK